MKNIIYIIISVLILFSCKKEDDKITISGKIVKDCSEMPFANQSFLYYNYGVPGIYEGQEQIVFCTDDEGNFSLECSPSGIKNEVELSLGANGGVGFILFNTEIDLNLGTLIIEKKVDYELKIKVNKPYVLGDTLCIYANFESGSTIRYKVPAPFVDTTITIINDFTGDYYIPSIENKNKLLINTGYSVYSSGSGITFVKQDSSFKFLLESCQNSIQELIVPID